MNRMKAISYVRVYIKNNCCLESSGKMLERITEFIIICFAILQIYTAYLAFKQVKQVGNKSASPFIALGV
ncbi:hypothetical protein IYO2065_03500 [Lactiplantibacillus plantarum]|nr:hypothetical protein IYO2065_03500 [Lactiplantibacillus plantarum]